MVLEARNGQEGLEICRTHEGPIDLLVSDVVMPELGGRELAEACPQAAARHESHVHVRAHTRMSSSGRAFRRGRRFCKSLLRPLNSRKKCARPWIRMCGDFEPLTEVPRHPSG